MKIGNLFISNNVIALVLIVILGTNLGINYYAVSNAHTKFLGTAHGGKRILGAVTTAGSMSLCVNDGAPRINQTIPGRNQILSQNATLQASLNATMNFGDLVLSFDYSNGSGFTFIGNSTFDGGAIFNQTWNTATVSDGNCIYQLRITGQSNETICQNFDTTYTEYFTIDNIYIPPQWDRFKNGVTTNFSTLTRYSNLSGVIIGTIYGFINFSGTGWNFDQTNLDAEIVIGLRSINFSLSSACFNPLAVNLTMHTVNLANPTILRNGEPCSVCSPLIENGTSLTFSVTAFGNYTAVGDISATISIWDATDSKGGYFTRQANQEVFFYANYTENQANQSVNGTGIYCQIRYNITEPTSPVNMSFNASSGIYFAARNFSKRGDYPWDVNCFGNAQGYNNKNTTNTVTITNTPPLFFENISSYTWKEDTILTGLNLYDHFSDADSDNLTFTNSPIQDILIIIASNGIVSFIPDLNWFGLRRITFYANDSLNATSSNNVTLVVTDTAESGTVTPPESVGSPGGGGGGGSGGGYLCNPEWYCMPWGICENNIRKRTCYDLNNCNTQKNTPVDKETCTFVGTCYDGIQNNNETGIDCGGQCPPCFTCYDRQKNQDETDIDCGGSICKPCDIGKSCQINSDCETNYCNPNLVCSIPSCTDGWQNQNEKGIDCGGVCPKCPTLEQPTIIEQQIRELPLQTTLVFGASLLVLATLINVFGASVSAVWWRVFYSFAPLKRPLPALQYEQLITHMNAQLNEIAHHARPNNIQFIFGKLIGAFNTFFEELFHLPQGFSSEQLEEHLMSSPLHPRSKHFILVYYTNLMAYRDPRLQEKHVQFFIEQGRHLLSLLLKYK